jgi:MFS transporter, ACS family, pantothenate transporter
MGMLMRNLPYILTDEYSTYQKIPTVEIIWGSLTMILASAKNFNTLVAIRFFVGLAESPFFPGIHYVLGSWYKSEELGKRAIIFQASLLWYSNLPLISVSRKVASAMGTMFSGALQDVNLFGVG